MAEKDQNNYQVRIFREVRPHFYLYITSQKQLEFLRNSPNEKPFAIAALVFMAFTIEAYANFLGSEILNYWNHLERDLSINAKLFILCDKLGLDPDFGKRPWQSIKSLLTLRNQFGHGKVKFLQHEYMTSDIHDDELDFPEVPWEKECTLSNVQLYLKDAEDVLTELHSKADLIGGPF